MFKRSLAALYCLHQPCYNGCYRRYEIHNKYMKQIHIELYYMQVQDFPSKPTISNFVFSRRVLALQVHGKVVKVQRRGGRPYRRRNTTREGMGRSFGPRSLGEFLQFGRIFGREILDGDGRRKISAVGSGLVKYDSNLARCEV